MIDLGIPMSQVVLAAEQTIYMVAISLAAGSVIAFIFSVILVLTRPHGILENRCTYAVFNTIINIVRSIPFIILLVFILPVTKAIVGTRIGTTAAFGTLDCVYCTLFDQTF